MKFNIEKLKKGNKLSPEYIKESRKRPGGSNVGKYPSSWDFAGPSGDAPKGSYPIPDIGHAKSALKLAHNAPNPEGIKKKVYEKFPQLKKQDGGQILYQMGGNFGVFQSGGKSKIKDINSNEVELKPARNKIQQFLLNLAGSWEHNKPQLLKDAPILDYAIQPTLDYLAGKGGEENALAILPIPGAIKQKDIIKNAEQTGETFYRRLTEGQMNKVIREKGKISPTKNEKQLTVTKSFPRKGDYILQLSSDAPLTKNEVITDYLNNFKTQTYQYPVDVNLLTGNHKLYKRVNKQLIPVDPKLYGAANKEALIDRQVVNSMMPAAGNMNSIPLGTEARLASNKIYTNPASTPFSLNTDYLANIENYGTGVYNKFPHIANDFNNPNFRKVLHYSESSPLYYTSKNPSENAMSNLANNIKDYAKDYSGNIKEEFNSSIMINSVKNFYKNHFGQDVSMLSNNDISKFIQKSYNDANSQGVLYHSTNVPITSIDYDLVGKNTGNQGWFGRGLYFSDTPTQDYGLLQEPFIHRDIEKKILINNYRKKGEETLRFTSPQKEVDEILSKVSKPVTKVNKQGKFTTTPATTPFGLGEKGKIWNDFLRKNNVDAVYSASTTKGLGKNFPEILITPESSAKLKTLYPHPELIEEAIQSGKINRDWNNSNIYKGLIPIGLGLGAYKLNEKFQKGGNIDLYNRLNPKEGFGLMSFINNGIQYVFGGGKPRKGFNLATPEEEAYWKLYNKVPQELIKTTNVRINSDKGDTKSDYVGMPESMKERISAMADTLNLGKIVRNPESFRTRFPNSPINYLGLKRNYEFAKKVMDNPGKGQQAKEIYSIKESPIKNTGLGTLEDFGLVWDKDKKVLKAYDTYDFPSILDFVIPKRDKELKIREEIPFNPLVGSNLLKDNFKNWDIVK